MVATIGHVEVAILSSASPSGLLRPVIVAVGTLLPGAKICTPFSRSRRRCPGHRLATAPTVAGRMARGAPPTIGLAPTKAGLLLVSIEKSSPRRVMAFVLVFSEIAVDPLSSANVPLMLAMLT